MPNYTIRVYGLWINEKQEILVSDERIGELRFTKFPGGGMEKGEGTIDCLKREWQEELDVEVEIMSHFYTTDFFQSSAFHTDTQVISIYYLVKPEADANIKTAILKNNFSYNSPREESFRFVALQQLSKEDLTFPIDKYVVELLLQKMLASSEHFTKKHI